MSRKGKPGIMGIIDPNTPRAILLQPSIARA
jgi:hypothetical protein